MDPICSTIPFAFYSESPEQRVRRVSRRLVQAMVEMLQDLLPPHTAEQNCPQSLYFVPHVRTEKKPFMQIITLPLILLSPSVVKDEYRVVPLLRFWRTELLGPVSTEQRAQYRTSGPHFPAETSHGSSGFITTGKNVMELTRDTSDTGVALHLSVPTEGQSLI